MKLFWTESALEDLRDLRAYIAADSDFHAADFIRSKARDRRILLRGRSHLERGFQLEVNELIQRHALLRRLDREIAVQVTGHSYVEPSAERTFAERLWYRLL